MIKASNISKRRSSALKEGSAEYLAKRAELLAIAANQFKTKGYRSAKLAEIGLKAGLDRATVYYYFGSKEELFRERSEEHTSELQSLMRISYAVFCLKKKKKY